MCCVEYQLCTSFGALALADAGTFGGAANMGVGSGQANAATNLFVNPAWSIDLNAFPYMYDTVTAVNYVDSTATVQATNFGDQVNTGLVDSQCSGDYVEIPSSYSGACGGSARNSINTRYCGARFGANFQAGSPTAASTPVCDCSEPFVVRHNSDTVNDIGGTGIPTVPIYGQNAGNAYGFSAVNTNNVGNAVPRGFCLDYKQLPCWN